MYLAALLWLVIVPNAPLVGVVFGALKVGWLKALMNSPRI
jgi:hypothetical protein